jgi:hypothetical protein
MKPEQTELTLSTKNNEMVDIINRSGLPPTDANVILAGFERFFNVAAEWEEEARTIVITDENYYTPEGIAAMERAGVGRKFLKGVRLEIEKTRKAEKEVSLRKGQVIDGIAKALTASASLTEIYLGKQENFAKLKAAAEVERLMEADRKKAEEARIKQEEAEEAERVAEQDRMRKENERLRKEAEKREKAMAKERKAAEKVLADERAKAQAERHEAEKREWERQEQLKDERAARAKAAKAQDAKIAKQNVKAAAERERLLALIQKPIECPHCHETFTLEVTE